MGLFLVTAAGALLAAFTLRRWLFLVFSLLPARERAQLATRSEARPPVLLLVPLYNESGSLPGCLARLARLDYPQTRLTILLVDDGSDDGTPALCRAAAAGRANWHTLSLSRRQGKAAALETALAQFPEGEVVAVYDADARPRPDALRRLVALLAADPRAGAVSGRRAVANPLAGPAATYATYENLVHQLVTQRAKDRLALAPAVLGANCVYRRRALAEVGGFRPGALLEDSDLTVRLACAGWRLRFAPGAASSHAVPSTLRGYWRQHLRWSAGFNAVVATTAADVVRAGRLPRLLRLELLAFAAGYLDRAALLLLLLGGLLRRGAGGSAPIVRHLLTVALLTPLAQVVAALALARAPGGLWLRLPLLPVFFVVDVAAAVVALIYQIRGRAVAWHGRDQETRPVRFRKPGRSAQN